MCVSSYYLLLPKLLRKEYCSAEYVLSADVQTQLRWDTILSPSRWKSLLSWKMTICYKLDRQQFRILDQLLHAVLFNKMKINLSLYMFRAIRFIDQQVDT